MQTTNSQQFLMYALDAAANSVCAATGRIELQSLHAGAMDLDRSIEQSPEEHPDRSSM